MLQHQVLGHSCSSYRPSTRRSHLLQTHTVALRLAGPGPAHPCHKLSCRQCGATAGGQWDKGACDPQTYHQGGHHQRAHNTCGPGGWLWLHTQCCQHVLAIAWLSYLHHASVTASTVRSAGFTCFLRIAASCPAGDQGYRGAALGSTSYAAGHQPQGHHCDSQQRWDTAAGGQFGGL